MFCTVQLCNVLYCTVIHFTTLYCTIQYVMYCNVQCSDLVCIIHSTVLYDTGQRAQVDIYFSAAHILSRKGLNSMNPSSFSGSHSSFMRALASSLVSFSPRFVRRRKSSFPIMVSSPFLS